MNEIFLDTETTGLSVNDKHRIVEVACIETNDLLQTKRVFHKMINPQRTVPEEAFKVHGFSTEFLKTKDYNKTLKTCHSTVGVAILNTSITIVFGFSILVFSKFIPTIYFGVFTGIAMLLAMISVLTLLPSLILVSKPFGK